MKTIYISFLILLSSLCFQSLNGQKVQAKTQIMVLGTPHLNNIANLEHEMLEKVLSNLNKRDFDAICVEQMPGQLLYDIDSRDDEAFNKLIEQFAKKRLVFAEIMQEQLNFNFYEAKEELSKLLSKKEYNDNERIKLIKLFTATTNLASASLHYKLLKKKSNGKFESLPKDLVQVLETNLERKNEIYSLALPLAIQENIKLLIPIDNFQDETLLLKEHPEFMSDYRKNMDLFKDIPNLPHYQKIKELTEKSKKRNNLFPLYKYMNSKEYQQNDYDAQWAIWLKTGFESGSDRARYSLWEMRNMQIAANILNTTAHYPGKKILVIIGASHVSFIQKHLKQVPDIEIFSL